MSSEPYVTNEEAERIIATLLGEKPAKEVGDE